MRGIDGAVKRIWWGLSIAVPTSTRATANDTVRPQVITYGVNIDALTFG